MAEPSASPPLMAGAGPPPLPQEMQARAKQLGSILGIPASTFAGKEMPAYQIMSHLAAMPTVKDNGRRHAYGNEVLGNLNKLLPIDDPENQPFYGRVAPLVGQMQEFPAWFANFAKSNEELVNDYVLLDTILTGMAYAGLPSFAAAGLGKSAISKGVIGAARKYEGRGALAGMDLAAGMGKAGMAGARTALTGGFATSPFAVVWLIGAATATALTIQQNEIKAEIVRRFQNRTLSSELYQKALGTLSPLPQQYFYDLS